MTFPEGNVMSDYGGARQTMQTNPTVKQAFQNGGIAAGATSVLRTTYRVLSRRKAAEEGVARLARVLTTLDLTALGVGSTLGVGVYVLAGDVAKNNAGPAVVLSFLIAAVASLFAGLCYAEFGARVPKAGSAYVYSYVCVGEFIAFIIGWNLILEYIIGAASVTKALSVYLDALVGKAISTKLLEWMPMDSPHLAKYPDVFAFAIVMLFSVALAFGVKESTKFNNFCTIINLCVVLFIIISGSFKADPKNWRIPPSQVPPRADGKTDGGGFMPYGMAGVIEGAAACFYGFIGFDCVATAGEEARSPQRSIPAAMVASLFIAFLAYFGVSSTLTLVLPYYMQDDEAPFPHMYSALGWDWAQYVVSVGAVCALCTSLLGAVFPLPRILFAMSCDGLVFRALAALSARGTPTRGTIVAGLFTGTLAMLFELKLLIHMMSIGTLMAYSMVAACVMLLRYECPAPHRALPPRSDGSDASAPLLAWRQLLRPEEGATPLSGSLVSALVTFYGAWAFVLIYCIEYLHYAWALVAAVPAVLALLAVHRQPQADKKLAFSVPLVPWLPGLSILINVHLMMNLDVSTWLRFCVWLGLGLIIYLTYGVWHSSERRTGATQQVPLAELHTDSHTALLDPLTHSLG